MPPEVSLTVADALHLARQLQTAGLADDADLMYRRLIEVAPDELDPLHFYGVFCHQQGRMDEAETFIRRILELAPENPDAHNNLGNVLQSRNRFDEAEARYRKAIELKPDHPSAYSNLGVVLATTGRNEEALSAYRTAAELDPDSADVRCNLGNSLRRCGELGKAVTAYQDAIRVNPWHDDSWNGLAQTFRMADRPDLAAQVFEDWLRFRPDDPSIQYLKEACCGKRTPERAPDAYIRRVFDQFADRFDVHLETLEYRAPQLICRDLSAVLPPLKKRLDLLDAGCGTGLCGPLLAPYARTLTGIDLSPGMLTKAEQRQVYDNLVMAELVEFMERHPDAYDAIVCCDTLCYFGDLAPVFAAVRTALRPGGSFGFTLEAGADDGSEVKLNPTGRYVHRRSYVYDALGAAGLTVRSYACETLRTEGRAPVAGHVIVAVKSADTPP